MEMYEFFKQSNYDELPFFKLKLLFGNYLRSINDVATRDRYRSTPDHIKIQDLKANGLNTKGCSCNVNNVIVYRMEGSD